LKPPFKSRISHVFLGPSPCCPRDPRDGSIVDAVPLEERHICGPAQQKEGHHIASTGDPGDPWRIMGILGWAAQLRFDI